MAKIFFLFILLGSHFAFSEEGDSSLSLAPKAASVASDVVSVRSTEKWLPSWKFFLNTYPYPILSGGVGIGVERLLHPQISFGFESGRTEQATTAFVGIEKGSQHIDDWRYLGARFFWRTPERHSAFLGAGYKWTEVDLMASPGLLSGPRARKEEQHNGAYGSAGYRWNCQPARIQCVVDAEIAYAPGELKRISYLLENFQARLETDIGYGWFPRARVGVTF